MWPSVILKVYSPCILLRSSSQRQQAKLIFFFSSTITSDIFSNRFNSNFLTVTLQVFFFYLILGVYLAWNIGFSVNSTHFSDSPQNRKSKRIYISQQNQLSWPCKTGRERENKPTLFSLFSQEESIKTPTLQAKLTSSGLVLFSFAQSRIKWTFYVALLFCISDFELPPLLEQ